MYEQMFCYAGARGRGLVKSASPHSFILCAAHVHNFLKSCHHIEDSRSGSIQAKPIARDRRAALCGLIIKNTEVIPWCESVNQIRGA